MKGFGTVVTGTLISGTVHKEQELEVHPAGKRLRVRGVQVHGAAAEQAIAGQRTALNLAGVETAELARGMMLTPPRMFRPTKRVSVTLDLLRSAKPLRDRARVHLHAFTAETIAEVSLLGAKQLPPGRVGLGAAEARRSAAAVARRSLHHPAVLSGDHHRRRTSAGCGRGAAADEGGGARWHFCRRWRTRMPQTVAAGAGGAARRDDGLSISRRCGGNGMAAGQGRAACG